MKLNVFYHDNCFDGAASAALFTRFYLEKVNSDATILYRGLVHKSGDPFDLSAFDGDENAIVDFKYYPTEKLTWWFDHHQSAFLNPEHEAHFRAHQNGRKFVDPSFKSCTKFIATVLKERFGFEQLELSDLVEWADIIDGAQYRDAKTAVEMRAPAMQLTLILENNQDKARHHRMIRDLAFQSLHAVMSQPDLKEKFDMLYTRHLQSMDWIRQRAQLNQHVLFFDATDLDLAGYNKFIPYYLFPACVYSVSILSTPHRTKISVGSNPWNQAGRQHNLAEICERYGGGGHAQVSAISLAPGAIQQAQRIAQEIVAELQR